MCVEVSLKLDPLLQYCKYLYSPVLTTNLTQKTFLVINVSTRLPDESDTGNI